MRRLTLCSLVLLACPVFAQSDGAKNKSKSSPNAMQLYDLAFQEFETTLGDGFEEFTTVAAGIPPWEAPLTADAYEAAVAKSRSPRDLFVKAAVSKRCERADPRTPYSDDIGCVGVLHLALLVASHGTLVWEETPEHAVSDAISLLRCSRQLMQIEHRDGHYYAPSIEALGMRLMADLLGRLSHADRNRDEVRRLAEEFAIHTKTRRRFSEYPESFMRVVKLKWRPIPEPTADLSTEDRESLAEAREARAKAEKILNEFFAPLKGGKLPSLAEAKVQDREHAKGMGGALAIPIEGATKAQRIQQIAWMDLSDLDLNLSWPVECEHRYREWEKAAASKLLKRRR